MDVTSQSTKKKSSGLKVLHVVAWSIVILGAVLLCVLALPRFGRVTQHVIRDIFLPVVPEALIVTAVFALFVFLIFLLGQHQQRRYERRLRTVVSPATVSITAVDPKRSMPATIVLTNMPDGLPDLTLTLERTEPLQYSVQTNS